MGAILALKFPTKEIRDAMFSFVQLHLLTLEFSETDFINIIVDKQSTLDCICIEKARGNKIIFDYPIWFSGPYRLWLDAFVKWASVTAGIRKTKVDGKTFDVPVPVMYHDAVGYYNLELRKNGQPNYYSSIHFYIYSFSCKSYETVHKNFWKEYQNLESRQKVYFKYFGKDVKPITSKINRKLNKLTKLWSETCKK